MKYSGNQLVKIKVIITWHEAITLLIATVLYERYQLIVEPRVNISKFLLDHCEVVAAFANVVELV